METHNNLPLYIVEIDADIETEEGVDFVALVERPAIQRGFLAFSEQTKMAFEITSEERRIVSGPLMLASTPIYRVFGEEECYVSFPPSTVECIVHKFFKQGYHTNVNLEHDNKLRVDGVVMFESWITDQRRGILPMKGFEDAPDGSWFGSFRVENDEVWKMVKEGTFRGFSIEGLFQHSPALSLEEALLAEVLAALEKMEG